MTLHVVGLDISLTSSGVGVITQRTNGTYTAAVTSIKSKGKKADRLPQTIHRIETITGELDHAVGRAVLALIESPSYGSKGGKPVERHHLYMSVIAALVTRGIPIAVVAPTQVKKAMTDNGHADKAAVSTAAQRLWPDVEIGNEDEGDGLAVAHLAAVHLCWQVPTLVRHTHVATAIEWPELPTAPAVA